MFALHRVLNFKKKLLMTFTDKEYESKNPEVQLLLKKKKKKKSGSLDSHPGLATVRWS